MPTDRAAPAALVMLAALGWSWVAWIGFQGLDDLHYLHAATRWWNAQPYVPADHWEARLPFVVLLALGLRSFGENTAGMAVPCALVFVGLMAGSWGVARAAFGARTALWTLVAVALTPEFFRAPSTFYPDALEAALAVAAAGLTAYGLWGQRGGVAWFTAAGLVAGVALLTRETAAAVPLGLAVLIWLERRGWRALAALAAGAVLPSLLEGLYYASVAGAPFLRLAVDSRGATMVSAHLEGGAFTGTSPLFNMALAALWNPPSAFRVHWSVNALVNLFTTPAWLLLPWLGVAGAVLAWRTGGRGGRIGVLALTTLGFQYVLDTFVIALPPSPRYFAASAALLALPAGLLLASLWWPVRAMIVAAMAWLAALVAAAPISPAPVVEALRHFASPAQVYVSAPLADAATLAARADPAFAARLRTGSAPVGALAVMAWDGWPADTLSETCREGALTGMSAWEVLARRSYSGALPDGLRTLGLARFLPERAQRYVDRPQADLTLLRRRC